ACSTVRDESGEVIRRGCGTLFTRKQFHDNWYMCPGCFRPDTLDPYTYADLLLERDSFYELGEALTVENIDGWATRYDYSSTRRKMEEKGSGKEALVIGYGM